MERLNLKALISGNIKNKRELISFIKTKFNIDTINKNDIYPSEEVYNIIINNVFVLKDNKLYAIDKLFFNTKLSKRSLYTLNNFIFDYFDEFPFIIDENSYDKINQIINEHIIKTRYKDYFILNSSSLINYENTEQLNKIQSFLLSGKDLTKFPGFSSSSFTLNYWLFRGWDVEYAKQRIIEIQSNNSKKFHNKKYTDLKWYNSKQTTNIEYWLVKGYSEDEAKKLLHKRQRTFSKDVCVEKYGIERGLSIFNKRQDKWKNTLMSKDDYLEIIEKRTKCNGYSNISQELFDKIYENIKHLNLKVYYATLNHEWGIGIKSDNKNNKFCRGCLYDFVIPSLHYAIEFNGEKFHPRKDKLSDIEWKNWHNPYSNDSADTIYKLDEEKNNALIQKGFTLDIIWYNDYIEDKNKIINDISSKILTIYENSIA